MKILITGGAGFIGSHLADHLLSLGYKVLVMDTFATGRRDNLTQHTNLQIEEGSISNKAFCEAIFEQFKPEVVIHAAASYKDPSNWEEDALTNVLGTTHIVKSSLKNNVQRLIYFQTSLCYGMPASQPITLDHPLHPESSYAISKTAAEHYIALSGLDFISFRLANVFGPRNLSGPVPTFYNRLHQKKTCFVVDTRRDFLFIRDLVELVSKAVLGEGRKGYYHVSSGKDISIHELYLKIVQAMRLEDLPPVEIRPRQSDDVPSILLDPSKTTKDFGWATQHDWREGVKAAVSWYQTHHVNETYTHLAGVHAKIMS